MAHSLVAEPRGARSLLATAVGYVLVAVIALIVLRTFIGTIFWVIRSAVVVAVIAGLLALYVKLKTPDD